MVPAYIGIVMIKQMKVFVAGDSAGNHEEVYHELNCLLSTFPMLTLLTSGRSDVHHFTKGWAKKNRVLLVSILPDLSDGEHEDAIRLNYERLIKLCDIALIFQNGRTSQCSVLINLLVRENKPAKLVNQKSNASG